MKSRIASTVIAAGILAASGAGSSAAVPLQQDGRGGRGSDDQSSLAEGLKAGACAADPSRRDAADVQPWHGGPGLSVVAAIQGRPTARAIGTLCVSLLGREDGRLAAKARLREAIAPPPEIDPVLQLNVAVDPLAYRFAPGEAAIAVRVTQSLNTETVSSTVTTFYLFRRQGDRLNLILDRVTAAGDRDKVSGRHDDDREDVIRFSARQTKGVFDLIVVPAHGRQTVYQWDGTRYRSK